MPRRTLAFRVEGKAVTQGSMNPGRGGHMYHKPALQPWRDKVWEAAATAGHTMGYFMPDDDGGNQILPVPKDFAVRVTAYFYFARPKKPTFEFPARADLDKLQRAIGDALSVPKKGRLPIITDDDQIVQWTAYKGYDKEAHVDIVLDWYQYGV